MTETKEKKPATVKSDPAPENKTCGIVMPISSIDGCTADHWQDVNEILSDAIRGAGFEPRLVSTANDSGIIHKRIIENLYNNPIVVCDVSAKNPNVMFELGMRLAFDKATIVVKDDRTDYSFDTSPIEHLGYPRDLRHKRIVEFKGLLEQKIRATYEASISTENYSAFVKHVGDFSAVKIDQKEVGLNEFVLEKLNELQRDFQRISLRASSSYWTPPETASSPPYSEDGRLGRVFRVIFNDTIPMGLIEDALKTSDLDMKFSRENDIAFTIRFRVPISSRRLYDLLDNQGLGPGILSIKCHG